MSGRERDPEGQHRSRDRNRAGATVGVDLPGVQRSGRAVDLTAVDLAPGAVDDAGATGPDAVDPVALAAAVRDPADGRVDCPEPGAAHEHVGVVTPACDPLGTDRRAALAAVARSLGDEHPDRNRVERLREELASLDPPAPDLGPVRERVAETGADVERLRERVATLRGRVRALREADADPAAAEHELERTARELSEAETEHAAAREALAAARREARTARDDRERRLALQDRLGNLRRAVRADFADRVRERVTAALVATPGATATALDDADPVSQRLALARVAALRAPVVLAARRFPDAASAARWLDAPVLRC